MAILKMKKIFLAIILGPFMTTIAHAETVQVHAHGANYSIDLTENFCFLPDHPVAVESRRLLSLVKKPLLVFLKCNDKFGGNIGEVSSFSKPISGDDIAVQTGLNNEVLKGFLEFISGEELEHYGTTNFPDNQFFQNLNQKMREGSSIEDWSLDRRVVLSADQFHIVFAQKIELQIDEQSTSIILLQAAVAKAPAVLFINIRLGKAKSLESSLVGYYGKILKEIAHSVTILD
jgi:hypothetical protein